MVKALESALLHTENSQLTQDNKFEELRLNLMLRRLFFIVRKVCKYL